MMKKLSTLVCLSPLMLALGGCETAKSSNPLSPTVAGPIPGVEITAPKILEPNNGWRIAVDNQPVTLWIENASSNGPRPLSYTMEVATDVNFSNKVFERTGIPPGDGGRTNLRLPDRLATGRSYYWRARAEDGANTGAYSSAANFEVYTPIVIEPPVPIEPAVNATISGLRVTFVFNNAVRSGPVGPISYTIEVAETDSFAEKFVIGPIAEQSGQTRVEAPQDAHYSNYYFWHVRASDGTNFGPWSRTMAFSTPPEPAPVPAPGGGGGGGGNGGGHIPAGAPTEDRARQVVVGTYNEFPHLHAVFGSEGEAVSAADQLLRRTIWHLHLAGFQAGRQRNPSGAISSDKLTIFINGGWHVYDIYSLGFAGKATTVQFVEVPLPNHVPDGGIPD